MFIPKCFVMGVFRVSNHKVQKKPEKKNQHQLTLGKESDEFYCRFQTELLYKYNARI